jgi:hypothetical protein
MACTPPASSPPPRGRSKRDVEEAMHDIDREMHPNWYTGIPHSELLRVSVSSQPLDLNSPT